MKIMVISGSTRAGSRSLQVAEYLKRRLESFGAEAKVMDLYVNKLPVYDDDLEADWQLIWQPMMKEIESSDGFVFVSPEWDGMFGVGLHNLFNYVGSASPNVMAHKPVTLVGVSSGMGGVYPLAQMRMAGPKNTHYVVTPENIRLANVKEVLVDGEIVVEGVRERADYSLKILIEYAKALKQIRETPELLNFDKFGSGV